MNREPDRIDEYGDQYWYDEGGKCHNDDNGFPAIFYKNGAKLWCKHGILHNEFGPAIIWDDGYKEWYINGVKYTEKEFKQHKIKEFINE